MERACDDSFQNVDRCLVADAGFADRFAQGVRRQVAVWRVARCGQGILLQLQVREPYCGVTRSPRGGC